MHIGMTYDLRDAYLAAGYSKEETAEFDHADTISAIEQTLQRLGHQTERIGSIQHLTTCLAHGKRWELVFNIAEGLYGFGREAQVPALLDAYAIPYTFSDPLVLAMALHKGMSKHVMRSLGIPTADFMVIATLAEVAQCSLALPLFVKPVAEGTSKGISAASTVQTWEDLSTVCERLLEQYHQPVLVETFLPGREFTVGIVGTGEQARVIGVMEVLLGAEAEPQVYSYDNKALYVSRVTYRLAEAAQEAEALALRAWRGLGCRDAGRVDLRCAADGSLQCLEVNPLAGLHPIHSDLPILCRLAGMDYETLLAAIVASASCRIPAASAATVRHLMQPGHIASLLTEAL